MTRACRARAPIHERLSDPSTEAYVLDTSLCQSLPVGRSELCVSHVDGRNVHARSEDEVVHGAGGFKTFVKAAIV